MKVLLTNLALSGRSGTEILTRNIAQGLLRRGHSPLVYALSLGDIADEIRSFGIPVTDRIANVADAPDIIHGHHNPTTATAIARFSGVPAIFICHDFVAWHDAPPIHPSVRRYVGNSATTVDRLVFEAGVPLSRTVVLPNAVDLQRFVARSPPPTKLRRALVLAKGLPYLDTIKRACAARSIQAECFGSSVGRPVAKPEELFPHYDIVFTSGIGAMEALACNRAVIVCDARGLAGLCTPRNYEAMRDANFGLRILTRQLTEESIGNEIDSYDPEDAGECHVKLREDADFDKYIERLISIYCSAITDFQQDPPTPEAQAIALSNHIEIWAPRAGDPRWPWSVEREMLIKQVERFSSFLPTLVPGEIYNFGGEGEWNWLRPVSGLNRREFWGVAAEGEWIKFIVRLPPDCRQGGLLEIKANALVNPARPQLQVDVFVSGSKVDSWDFEHPTGSTHVWHNIRYSKGMCDPQGEVGLAFKVHEPRSPAELGINTDTRKLGLGLTSFRVSPQ